MRKVLLLVPSLGYSGTSKQLLLLATGLPRPRFEVRVAVLGPSGSPAESLRANGIEVQELGWNRLFDWSPFRRLRRLVEAFSPDVIHAWHSAGLRALAFAAAGGLLLRSGTPGRTRTPEGREGRPPRGRSRVLISAASHRNKPGAFRQPLDRWLLRRADRVVAAGPSEAEHYRRLDVAEEKIVQVPPGVAPAPAGTRDRLRPALPPKETARLVVCAGPLLPGKGFQDAIWAFEILRYLFDDLHLVFLGDGPDRGRLEQFARDTGAHDRVHFLGSQPDVAAFLGHGEVVWVPSRRHGGVNVALEAMAAGRPVVASRLPALAEVLTDGATGWLIDPGDKVALARTTRLLLDDPKRGQQMGEAGRQRIEREFTAAQFVDRLARLYEQVSGES